MFSMRLFYPIFRSWPDWSRTKFILSIRHWNNIHTKIVFGFFNSEILWWCIKRCLCKHILYESIPSENIEIISDLRYLSELDTIFFKICFVQITTCMVSAVSIFYVLTTVIYTNWFFFQVFISFYNYYLFLSYNRKIIFRHIIYHWWFWFRFLCFARLDTLCKQR